jgi:hypothetical protein
LVTTKSENRGYRLKFLIPQPTEWVGQTVSLAWALTPQAAGYAKRDLSLLGLGSSEKLLRPFPYETSYVYKVSVVQRRDETGRAWNEIVQFDAVRAEPLSLALVVEGTTTTGGETDFPSGANDGGTDP